MGYNVDEVLINFNVKLKSKFKILWFLDDFKLTSFLKTKHKICKEFVHFLQILFIKS